MKTFSWTLVVLLAIACVVAWFRPPDPLPTQIRTETNIRTVIKVDTLRISSPMAPLLFIQLKDTIHIGDTVVNREQACYKDSLYQAWVSGYHPRLDSIEVYPRTVFQEVTNDIYHNIVPKRKRWGLGLQAGYSYPNGLYLGVGISYNLFMW